MDMSTIEKLKQRFEESKLQTKLVVKERLMEDENGQDIRVEKQHLLVSIPEERDFKNIVIADDDEIEKVLESKIEKYRFIKGYEAIWSPEFNYVECEVEAQEGLLNSPRILLRRLKNLLSELDEYRNDEEDTHVYEFPSPKEGLKIMLGTSTLEFAILQGFQKEFFTFSGRLRNRITIRIEGQNLNTHEEATDFLIKIANSVLFQIDLATNIPLHLIMDRQIIRGIKQRKTKSDTPSFQPPKYEYDKEPLALYWYARTSTNMPLLQFLAFYQVMEFYFPLYSFTEAQQRIKNLLKNPLFDTNKDTDVAQIINIIKVSAKGKSIGDEKSQIKATIQHIVDKDVLLAFYNENDERRAFFDHHKKTKGISKQKISFGGADTDIRLETALRIYEIRNRIVHSKEEDEAELLLPYSSEIKNIKHDLELVEFLARKAIIVGARPLTL